MASCPCGSNREYEDCCGPFHNNVKQAPTAEALMRSRYSAYAIGDIEYVKRTTHPSNLKKFDEQSARQWAEGSKWLGLNILSVEEGEDAGRVEFTAKYSQNDEELEHHEIAQFSRQDDQWLFVDGKVVNKTTFVRETPKVGRNDPCTCNSGKKYKKCCGKKG